MTVPAPHQDHEGTSEGDPHRRVPPVHAATRYPTCPACGHNTSAFTGACTEFVFRDAVLGYCAHRCDGEPAVWDALPGLELPPQAWTFRQWLIRTHRASADRRGELARGVEQDRDFPHPAGLDAVLGYCARYDAPPTVRAEFTHLWSDYEGWRAAVPEAAGTPVPAAPRPPLRL